MMKFTRRHKFRMKVVVWVLGAFAVLVTFIADDVDPQITPDNTRVSETAQ